MAGVNSCIKYSVFIFNFFFWICGILVLALAIWARVNRTEKEFVNDSGMSSNTSANILIAVGATIMIMGFLGCCGAMRENRCMLLMFFIGLLLILFMQVAAGVVGVVYRFEYESALNETIHNQIGFLNGTDEKSKLFQKSMIKFQKEFKCCGLIYGASDWEDNFKENSESCECADMTDSLCVIYEGKHVYKQTCLDAIKDLIRKHINIIIGLAFGMAAIEVLGMIFSMVLFCQIGNK